MMTRFFRYIEKVFGLSEHVARLSDSRQKPQIDTGVIFLSAMMMCVTRLRSLNALESEFRVPGRWEKILGKRKPSADSVGKVVNLMDSELLRDMLSHINHRLRRNKALDENPWPLRFVAFDGHRTTASRSKNKARKDRKLPCETAHRSPNRRFDDKN